VGIQEGRRRGGRGGGHACCLPEVLAIPTGGDRHLQVDDELNLGITVTVWLSYGQKTSCGKWLGPRMDGGGNAQIRPQNYGVVKL
jgi:hypothetical protein